MPQAPLVLAAPLPPPTHPDDTAVLARLDLLDAHVGRGGAHEAERRHGVAVEHELEGLVVGRVDHLVVCEAGVEDEVVDLRGGG
jgi:hypothetical protein